MADVDTDQTPHTTAIEARHALARIAPQAVGIADLALLTGRRTDDVERQLVLSGYSAAAVQAARAYIDAKRRQ